jgi:hypothetical protein
MLVSAVEECMEREADLGQRLGDVTEADDH